MELNKTEQIITIVITALIIFVILTLLIRKIINVVERSSNAKNKKMIQDVSETTPTQKNENTWIERKEQIVMIERKEQIKPKKQKVERYCYKVNGEFKWKARKNTNKKTKKPLQKREPIDISLFEYVK